MRLLLVAICAVVGGGAAAAGSLFGAAAEAHAEPLDEIAVSVTDGAGGPGATVRVSWNHDDSASRYEVGCVSCMPNFVTGTSLDQVTVPGVTALDNGIALLYVIAYDGEDRIIAAQQVMADLN